ncbi:MAG: hypothetical protein OEY97_07780 [Nitrospirota bacterium]|nr:hypothetical protein [Gammaproteobacteria bacterium]MDH5527190.1 hypothetical protein [Nitrospirota bacterium]
MPSFQFVGQPEDSFRQKVVDKGTRAQRLETSLSASAGDGPDKITKFGFTFKKNGPPVEVPEIPGDKNNERVLDKLRNCGHFKEVSVGGPQAAPHSIQPRRPGRPKG